MQDDTFLLDVESAHATIRSNVKRIREQRGITQMEVALGIGHASQGFFGKAEVGIQNKRFNIEHLVKIAKILSCDICEFFKPIEAIQSTDIETAPASNQQN